MLVCLAALLMMIWPAGCDRKAPIRIGFVGPLTGRHADTGISGRNAVLLAVEQRNAAGGIDGHPLQLIVRDDRHDPSVAVQVDRELVDAGIVAIVGHMTSAMSLAALPLINEKKIVMISPTASSNSLTGIDDYFFRVMTPNRLQTDRLAAYAFKARKLRRMAGIYDLSNGEYTDGFRHNFQAEFEYLGGEIVHMLAYRSTDMTPFADLVHQATVSAPDGLMVAASGYDTAMICQQLRRLGYTIPVIASSWAMTPELLRLGGQAAEGIIFCNPYDKECSKQEFSEFKHSYGDRFDGAPDFVALAAYDASQVLFQALMKSPDGSRLKELILQIGTFPGLAWDIEINRYGDAHTGQYLIEVIGGRFQVIDSWTNSVKPYWQDGN